MRVVWQLPLVLALLSCRKPRQVVLEATADPHPSSCTFHVVANSSHGPVADVKVEGRTWARAEGSDEGESFAVTATLEASTPDPACDVGLSCRVLVDGVEKKSDVSARKVRCSVTVR